MAFPTKMYFSLSEVSARWHRQTKDVEYCIENGLLNAHIKVCSVKLTSNMLLNKFPHNSQEIYEYTGCKRITPEDCHIYFVTINGKLANSFPAMIPKEKN